jgi:transketolase
MSSAATAPDTRRLANTIRALAMDAVQAANSGHPGMPMGMADVATVLFSQFLKFDAGEPEWPDRDRFVLSAGHGSMLLYALLHLTGYEDMTIDELKNFRRLGSRTAGHPEFGHAKGIETTTGPLGQGIATSVGMALAERHLRARFGADLVDHRTFVIASDGDLMEGVSHEASSLAGHQRLDRLIVLWDDNHISIDGPTDLSFTDDTRARFAAYGWRVDGVDGHDPDAVHGALARAMEGDRPSLIACRTTIGFGSPNKAGTHGVHGSPLGPEEVEAARAELGWSNAPFEIPDDVLEAWRAIGRRGRDEREAWLGRLEAGGARGREFERAVSGALPDDFADRLDALKRGLAEEKPKAATRVLSQRALEVFTEAVPEMVGGSADLTPSNNTKTKVMESMTPEDPAARYVRYGVREHGMSAAMNGMAVHRGVIPYGGTFLIFSDYSRPAIRIASLMHQRVIFVFTHDSIGLGEDGPTHQPVEHLAALRAMPGLWVFRPADGMECAECWAAALERMDGPSLMVLSRQGVEAARLEADSENLSARGGYVLREAEGGARKATILATGTEVGIALEARAALEAEGVPTAVVSLPCFELFEMQDAAYRREVLGTAPRVAVEAASPFGWTRYVDSEDDVVGMTGFGSSAPAEQLYEHFGITAGAVRERVKRRLT